MKRSAITVHGAFHGSNFGDLLLLQIQLSWLAEAGVSKVCIPSWNDGTSGLLHVPDGMQISGSSSNVIIFGGGGYFGAPTRAKVKWVINWTRYHAVVLAKAALTRKKVLLIGTGVGPLPPFPFNYLLRRAMQGAEVILPRDTESAEYLRELVGSKAKSPVDAGIDNAVWLAAQRPPEAALRSGDEVLGVHLAPPLDDVERFNEFLERLGAELLGYKGRIRVLVDQRGTNGAKRQRECGTKVATTSGVEVEVVEFETVNQFLAAIAGCDRVITSKLHVGVVARCYGVPVFSVPTHIKTIRFYRQIEEAERCKPWGSHEMSELVDGFGVFIKRPNAREPMGDEIILRGNRMKERFQEAISQC